jgi:hypothetical protein
MGGPRNTLLDPTAALWPLRTCTGSNRKGSQLLKPISISFCHIFRCEEHLYKRLHPSVRLSVGWLVGWSVPHDAITWKTIYIAIALRRGGGRRNWLCRDSITSRFHYVAIPSHLGIRWSPCFYFFSQKRDEKFTWNGITDRNLKNDYDSHQQGIKFKWWFPFSFNEMSRYRGGLAEF